MHSKETQVSLIWVADRRLWRAADQKQITNEIGEVARGGEILGGRISAHRRGHV